MNTYSVKRQVNLTSQLALYEALNYNDYPQLCLATFTSLKISVDKPPKFD
jgi:hypothetical protein